MSDLENQEFRECAEDIWGQACRSAGAGSEEILLATLAKAMRIAAEETTDYCIQVAGSEDYKAVASRISSRIKGGKMTKPYTERHCEECGENIRTGGARIRCTDCKKLLCSYCYSHSFHTRKSESSRIKEGR